MTEKIMENMKVKGTWMFVVEIRTSGTTQVEVSGYAIDDKTRNPIGKLHTAMGGFKKAEDFHYPTARQASLENLAGRLNSEVA